MKPDNRFYSLINFSILASAFISSAYFILFSGIQKLIYYIPDDSSYYFKIADNFIRGKGFSFDALNTTTGFQPLWQFILIPLTAITIDAPEDTLRIVLLFQLVLVSISCLIFTKTLSDYFSRKVLVSFTICFIVFVFFNAVNGMETSLLIFMLSVLFYTSNKLNIYTQYNPRNIIFFGIILGLVVLSRLDFIFLSLSVLVFCFKCDTDFKKIINIQFCIIAGLSVILIPYLLFNYFQSGHFMPVSGYLKSGISSADFTDKFRNIFQYRESYFALAAFIFFILSLTVNSKNQKSKNNNFIFALSVYSFGVVLLFLYNLFFLNWVLFYWYFIPYSLFISFFVCLIFSYLTEIKKYRWGNYVLILFSVFVLGFWGFKIYNYYTSEFIRTGNNWNFESYNASQWALKNTDPADVFAMKDAGHFGNFSRRSVINLDGLVNNFEYQEILNSRNLNDYLQKNKVKYYVQHAIWNRDDVTDGNYDTLNVRFVSHKYATESDALTLHKDDEVYRSEPYFDGKFKTVFIIWKIGK